MQKGDASFTLLDQIPRDMSIWIKHFNYNLTTSKLDELDIETLQKQN